LLKLDWKIDSYESFNAEQHHEPKILYNRVFINYFESPSILNHLVGIYTESPNGYVYKRYVIILEYGNHIEYVQKLIKNIKNASD